MAWIEFSKSKQQEKDAVQLLREDLSTLSREVRDIQSQMAKITDHNQQQSVIIEDYKNRISTLESQLVELAKRDQRVSSPDMLKYSNEPWFQFNGGKVDTDKGIELNIDWNSAFIQQLKANGYHGMNEMQIVSQWITAVAAQQQSQLFGDE